MNSFNTRAAATLLVTGLAFCLLSSDSAFVGTPIQTSRHLRSTAAVELQQPSIDTNATISSFTSAFSLGLIAIAVGAAAARRSNVALRAMPEKDPFGRPNKNVSTSWSGSSLHKSEGDDNTTHETNIQETEDPETSVISYGTYARGQPIWDNGDLGSHDQPFLIDPDAKVRDSTGKEIKDVSIPRPEYNLNDPRFPKFAGSANGYMSIATRERYAITWTAKEEMWFEMPTGGEALMNKGENLCYFRRKEACITLGKLLRKSKLENYKIYRIKKNGEVTFIHPADGVFPEKVNKGRVAVNFRNHSCAMNPPQAAFRFTKYDFRSYEVDTMTNWFIRAKMAALQDTESLFPLPKATGMMSNAEFNEIMKGRGKDSDREWDEKNPFAQRENNLRSGISRAM